MKTVTLPGGERVPALGQGSWNMGDDPARRADEIAALQLGLDLGLSLIDSAEMYGEGRAETLVGQALAGRRDQAFIVSKVYPHNASRKAAMLACERSLRRLQTDRIDLYLLHWRGEVPLAETLDVFADLQRDGKIRHFGVSNFDLGDMQELWQTPHGQRVATNQVLYNLQRRGVEWDLLPWMRQQGLPVMAYSPIEQARLLRNPKLVKFAGQHGMTVAQAALAWLLSGDGVMAIPKASHGDRVRENAAARDIELTGAQLSELNHLFAPPSGPGPLEMI
jgi:diketogulonate reductase-like aldo/keto reductase